ncbi:MAG: carbohydrate kinase family protein [Anaerolineales bacterium]|nr:carbohydrate kinase family protein [Anaerolineales bacterium]
MTKPLRAVVAGHICLDILPDFEHLTNHDLPSLLKPGKLVQIGSAQFCSGGPVSNTGLALHHLGIPTMLIAKTGDDPLGGILRQIIAKRGPELAERILVDPRVDTSYSIIISNRVTDRLFLHCTGANDTFSSADIDFEAVRGADIFHFGYPPALRRMYVDGGSELARVMRSAKETGATTSLDMSLPDRNAESGSVDWRQIYRGAMPYVDIFLPSLEELLFTLRRSEFERLSSTDGFSRPADPRLLEDIGGELLDMGVKIILVKMGEHGAYMRTAGGAALKTIGRARPAPEASWADRERWIPCFAVNAVGTTGAGDSTIAGFLGGLLRRTSIGEAMTMAVAVGACNVEAADSLSGLRTWEATRERVRAGWERRPLKIKADGWHWSDHQGMWIGPREKAVL